MVVKKHFTEVTEEKVDVAGAKNATIRWLIAKKDGADKFALRMFVLKKDGFTPEHSHNWEHEIFALEGEGMLATEEGDLPLKPGDFAYVPPMALHQFRNRGAADFKFLCIIPVMPE